MLATDLRRGLNARSLKRLNKRIQVFYDMIDTAMKSLGYCCGKQRIFSPKILRCYGNQQCYISRNAVYLSYQNRYKEKITYCKKCFDEIPGNTVELTDDPTKPPKRIKTKQFKRMKNNKLEYEEFVECGECKRKLHQICVLHLNTIWTNGFICNNCYEAIGSKRKENRYSARRLQTTQLGTFIGNRVNSFLQKQKVMDREVHIKVLSCTEKITEVKPGMKARFLNKGERVPEFTYRAKAIFAFEEIDGVDVCFFGMYVQEYHSNCPEPNNGRCYISYLDSVRFFQPRKLRTAVYHEILIGYIEYVKQMGFTWAHIWSCPPRKRDDYIFHCHPQEQKIPTQKRLREWYKTMLDKIRGINYRIYTDILEYARDNNLELAKQIPYFEGDFWPTILEEFIEEKDQEDEAKKKHEEVAAEQNCAERRKAKSGRKQRQCLKMNRQQANTKKTNMPNGGNDLHGENDITLKAFSTMESPKETFFVIHLQPQQTASTLLTSPDPDPYISCDLMDDRDAFLTMSRGKNLEFSSLRRAKYSTMVFLYELHNQGKDYFEYECNTCKAPVKTRWHCNVCEDFDLCTSCYEKERHGHEMYKLN